MVQALVNAFPGTDSHSHVAQQPVTAIDVDLIEATAELKAVEHLRVAAFMEEEIEGLMSTKLGARTKADWKTLRGCLKSSGCRESTQHETRHGEVDHGLTALR